MLARTALPALSSISRLTLTSSLSHGLSSKYVVSARTHNSTAESAYTYGDNEDVVLQDGFVPYIPAKSTKKFELQVQRMKKQVWEPRTVRAGGIAQKMGMMHLWDEHGRQIYCTVLRLDSEVTCIHEIPNKKGEVIMQMGAGRGRRRRLTKGNYFHFIYQGVEPKFKIRSFAVSPSAVLPVGWQMDVRHFKPGQHVDVSGITIGKGFQGVMKRHNFAGQPASHGVSRAHRKPGSIGASQGVGKVWKGKKMAGRMGGKPTTHLNLKVYKIDCKRNLLYVMGNVPGYAGNWVYLRDALFLPKSKQWSEDNLPPFPTYIPEEGEEVPDEILAEMPPIPENVV